MFPVIIKPPFICISGLAIQQKGGNGVRSCNTTKLAEAIGSPINKARANFLLLAITYVGFSLPWSFTIICLKVFRSIKDYPEHVVEKQQRIKIIIDTKHICQVRSLLSNFGGVEKYKTERLAVLQTANICNFFIIGAFEKNENVFKKLLGYFLISVYGLLHSSNSSMKNILTSKLHYMDSEDVMVVPIEED